jgi:hypothetical protein
MYLSLWIPNIPSINTMMELTIRLSGSTSAKKLIKNTVSFRLAGCVQTAGTYLKNERLK